MLQYFHSSGDLLDPWVKSKSLASPAQAAGFFTSALPGEPFVQSSKATKQKIQDINDWHLTG